MVNVAMAHPGGTSPPHIARGFRLNKPAAWNDFDGEAGSYERRWVDIVARDETVTVSTSPVKPTTQSVELLGDPKVIGAKFASARNAKLEAARARSTDGLLFYDFTFGPSADTNVHELLTLVVAKSKLWSISCKAPSKTWESRAPIFANVIGSFFPRL